MEIPKPDFTIDGKTDPQTVIAELSRNPNITSVEIIMPSIYEEEEEEEFCKESRRRNITDTLERLRPNRPEGQTGVPSVVSLLINNQCAGENLEQALNEIKTNTYIKSLQIKEASFHECEEKDNIDAIVSLLEENSSIESLILKGTKIGRIGAKKLATALEKNKSLKELDISNNFISKFGIEALAKMLEVNNTLTILDISDNLIGKDSHKALINSLYKNTSLKELDISGRQESSIPGNDAETYRDARTEKATSYYRNDGAWRLSIDEPIEELLQTRKESVSIKYGLKEKKTASSLNVQENIINTFLEALSPLCETSTAVERLEEERKSKANTAGVSR